MKPRQYESCAAATYEYLVNLVFKWGIGCLGSTQILEVLRRVIARTQPVVKLLAFDRALEIQSIAWQQVCLDFGEDVAAQLLILVLLQLLGHLLTLFLLLQRIVARLGPAVGLFAMNSTLACEALVSHQAGVLPEVGRAAHVLEHGYGRLRRLHRCNTVYIGKRFEQLLVKIGLHARFVFGCIFVRFVEKLNLQQVLDWEELAGLGRVETILIHQLAEQGPDLVIQVANFVVDGLFFGFYALDDALVDAVRAEAFVQVHVMLVEEIQPQVLLHALLLWLCSGLRLWLAGIGCG